MGNIRLFITKNEYTIWFLCHNISGCLCGSETTEITEFPVLIYFEYDQLGFLEYIEIIND